MDNKVGSFVPSAQKTTDWLTQLQTLRSDLEKYTVKLSPDERRHHLQFRPGGEMIVNLVADLADKYGVHLPDMPVSGMKDDMTVAQRLAPLASELALLLERIQDTIAQARCEAWQAATGNYSVLSRTSAANPSLAKEMEPAKAFFARRRKAQPSSSSGAPTNDH